METVTVRYESTVEDVVAGLRRATRSPVTIRQRIAIVVGPPVLVWTPMIVIMQLNGVPWPPWLAVTVVAVTATWVSLVLKSMRAYPEQITKQVLVKPETKRKLLGPTEVAISPARLSFCKDVTESSYAWVVVENVEATDDYLYVWLQPNMVAAIPRRAFDSDEAFRSFAARARAYWRPLEADQARV